MRLFIARHGESTWNTEGRYQGQKDPPLSERGIAQARALAERVRVEPIEAVYSSPLRRAFATAQMCAERLRVPLFPDGRLCEISHGSWEGRLRSEIELEFPEMSAAWRQTPDLVTFPSGECVGDVQARFVDFLNVVERSNRTTLLVTHDVILRLAILASQGKPLSSFQDLKPHNASLSEFELLAGQLAAKRLNENEFLGDLRSDLSTQAL